MGPVAPTKATSTTTTSGVSGAVGGAKSGVVNGGKTSTVKTTITPVASAKTSGSISEGVTPSSTTSKIPGTNIPVTTPGLMGDTSGYKKIEVKPTIPGITPGQGYSTGTSTPEQLLGGGGTTQKTIQTPGGSIQTTTIGGKTVISGGTSIMGTPSSKVVGGSYEAGGGSGGGRTYTGPVTETPIVRDVGWGTRIQEMETQTKFGYNPYEQEPSQKKAYDVALADLEEQKGVISKMNAEGTISNYNQISNDINKNIAVIKGYKESGYTINTTDTGYTFGTPKASNVVRYTYGGERPDVYIASELGSLGFGVLFSGAQDIIFGTGTKSLEAHKEQTAEAILGTTRQKGESIQSYTGRFWTSPKVVTEIYMPVAMMGAGALFTEGATIAKTSIGGVTGRATEFFAPVAERLAPITTRLTPITSRVSSLAEYTGESFKKIGGQKILQAEIKYGMYATMEAPGLIETARTHPERVGGMLGSSLFGWELSWGSMEYGSKVGIPSGEQAYYKYGKSQPTPTDIYFGAKPAKTTTITITEPSPGVRGFTEKTPSRVVTTMEEYPKRGRLEMYEMQKPRTSIEIPASYEQEVTRIGKGAKTLDIIEAKPGLTKGELLIEEPGKGRLTMTEFTPTAEMKYDLMLGTKTGLATPTSTLPYPGEGTGNLFESMPETTAQAIKSQELIHKPYDINVRPKGGWAETFYGQDYSGSSALKPPKPTSLTGAEPISEKGVFAKDIKKEENLFYKEISSPDLVPESVSKKDFVFDLGKTGVAKKEAVAVNVKGQTKVFTGEQLRGLGKGELKARPQRYTREQLETAIQNKPGAIVKVPSRQERLAQRAIKETQAKSGLRPEEGWNKFIGERQDAKLFIEKPKTYALPRLESEAMAKRTVIPSTGKTPLRFTKTTEPGIKAKPGEEIQTISSDTGLVSIKETASIKKTGSTKLEKGFEPSGLYESPDIKYFTMERPLTRQEYSILRDIGDFDRTTGGISRYWTGTKPGVKTTDKVQEGTIHGLLSSREGERSLMQPTLLGLEELTGLDAISVPRAEQQIKQTYDGDLIQRTNDKLGFKQGQEPGLLLGELPISLTGTREDVRQLQRTASLQEQLQKQELKQGILTKQLTETFTEPIRETRLPLKPREPTTEKPTKLIIPRFEPPKKPQTEEPSLDILGEGKPGEAYDVYVKERSMYEGKIRKPTRFTRINRGPLSYKDALSLGGEATDTTSAISFRLKKTKGTPEKPDRQVQDFSSRAQKFTRRGDTIIEKAEYRMDTPGEIKGISALGWRKRKGTGKTNTGLLSSISTGAGLPRNKSTGLFSSGNKLKENFLFRKKKNGGKKDAYY